MSAHHGRPGRPARPRRTGTALLLGAALATALLTAACGDGTAAAPDTPASKPAGTALPAPGDAATAAPTADGTWQSDIRPAGTVTDGRVLASTTRRPGEPSHVVALDATTGATRWDVPLGSAADALLATPVLLLAPDRPLLASYPQETATAGASGSAGWQVARLDPDTGRTLWSVTSTGPAVAAGPDAVLVGTRQGTSTDTVGAVALDPADGRDLWTSDDRPVLTEGSVAVLTRNDDSGTGTVLRAVDAATGKTRWTGPDTAAGTVGSRAVALAATADRLLVTRTTTGTADTTTRLLVLVLGTGNPVGPGLPAAVDTTVLLDPDSGTAVVGVPRDDGTVSVTGVDPGGGHVLWTLDDGRATGVDRVGGGLAWVRTADGTYTAVDDQTGTVRADRLDQAPSSSPARRKSSTTGPSSAPGRCRDPRPPRRPARPACSRADRLLRVHVVRDRKRSGARRQQRSLPGHARRREPHSCPDRAPHRQVRGRPGV